MKQQIIQNFLNLSGIVGLALIDEQSRPYFCGIDKALNFQQREALTEGIQQVISTTPVSFKAFDFRFSHQEAHIYKLAHGVILLVVTDEQVNALLYEDAVTQLRQTIQTNPQSVVSTFRLLSGNTPLSRHLPSSDGAPAPAIPPRASRNGSSPPPSRGVASAKSSPQPPPVADAARHSSAPRAASPSPKSRPYEWKQVILALNALTDATARYLGRLVVANAWQSTRLEPDPLGSLKVSRSGHFSYSNQLSDKVPILPEEQTALHQWVQRFTSKCALIIRDYPELVLQQMLNQEQRTILRIDGP